MEPAKSPPKPLSAKRGTPGVCRVMAVDESLVVDLGFACYRDLADSKIKGLQAGAFVLLGTTGDITAASDATKGDLFTYRATILKVVDGDTLWVKIHLTPELWVKQKLRLRDLDAPEIATPEGKAAKRFVESLLAEAGGVTICTTKPDKYDRYLADVFINVTCDPSTGSGQAKGQVTSAEEVFLNNALLTAGHAVPKKAWAFSDWGE